MTVCTCAHCCHRNCLTWRDVQSILVYSAVKFDVEAAEWVENGAGFHHSDQHGFGLMDAYRMTSVAGVWPLVPKLLKVQIPRSIDSPVPIPSNGSAARVEIVGKHSVCPLLGVSNSSFTDTELKRTHNWMCLLRGSALNLEAL